MPTTLIIKFTKLVLFRIKRYKDLHKVQSHCVKMSFVIINENKVKFMNLNHERGEICIIIFFNISSVSAYHHSYKFQRIIWATC